MSILMVNEAFNKGKADVREGASRLRKDRTDVDHRVSGFLDAGWTGVAADSFSDAWDDWKVAAHDVEEALVAMADLMEAAQKDFNIQDDASQAHLDAIAANIIERLG